jgi:hypothetical protein
MRFCKPLIFENRSSESFCQNKYRAKDQDKKPDIPDDFPSELKNLISLGWSKDPTKRPSIPEFKSGLIKMIGKDKTSEEFVKLINDPSCPKAGMILYFIK